MKIKDSFFKIQLIFVIFFIYACGQNSNQNNNRNNSLLTGLGETAGLWRSMDGWSAGVISKISSKEQGMKSLEVEMLMGQSTGIGHVLLNDIPMAFNPWSFSANLADKIKIEPYLNKQVYVRFQKAGLGYPSFTDTNIMFQELSPITDELPRLTAADCTGGSRPGLKGEGNRIGHVVSVFHKGTFVDSWEVIMQVSDSSNVFIQMSVIDQNVYHCAVEYLRSGKLVNIGYAQSYFIRNPLSRESLYTIFSITPDIKNK